MADPDTGFPPFPPDVDEGLTPDPGFWGGDDSTPRRSRHRRPGLLERIHAGSGRDRSALTVVLVAVVLGVALLAARVGTPGSSSTRNRPADVAPVAGRVVVDVAGAVTRPGVVDLPGGSRVVDALDAAGGALGDADLDHLNLAARVRDGERILVPHGSGAASTTTTSSTTTPP